MKKISIEIPNYFNYIFYKNLIVSIFTIYLFNHAGIFYTYYDSVERSESSDPNHLISETIITLSYKSPFGTIVTYPSIFKPEEALESSIGINSYLIKAECYLIALGNDLGYVILLTSIITLIFMNINFE